MIDSHGIAAVIGSYTLQVKQSRITLDDAWSPYVQADLVCAIPPEATLETIDPRIAPRVQLWLARGLPSAQSRSFNLVLVERTVDHTACTMTLRCASDEQLLQDFARVATTVDISARGLETSLRSIVSATLAKIGATLEPGSADFDCTIDKASVNYVTNPRLATNTNSWDVLNASGSRATSGGPSEAPHFYRATLSTAQTVFTVNVLTDTLPVGYYAISALVRSSVATQVRLELTGVASGGYVSLPANTWVRMTVPGIVVTTAAAGLIRVIRESGPALAAGTTLDVTAAFAQENVGYLTEDDYFDGSTATNAFFTYSWTGTAHGSTSRRTPRLNRSWQSLDWEPGETAEEFLAPLVQVSGLRLYCDESRRWYLVDPATPVAGQVNVTKGVNATAAIDTISRTRDWFDAVVVEYRWVDTAGNPQTTRDAAGPAGASKALTIRQDRPYPGPGAAQAVLTRSQGRGRVLELTALCDYTVTPGQALAATIPAAPVQNGVVSAVTWRTPDFEMDIKSRGLTDTPTTSWLALSATEKWTDSPVGGTWTGE